MQDFKTSFLNEMFSELYECFDDIKPFGLYYGGILLVFFVLSLFVQWTVVQIVINLMMGWTFFSAAFVGTMIVMADKQVRLIEKQKEWSYSETEFVKPKTYKLTVIYGCILILAGFSELYFSSKYKDYYNFQCQTFYLDSDTHILHTFKKCDHIRGKKLNIHKVLGANLDKIIIFEPCIDCLENEEDYEVERRLSSFTRK